MEYLIVTSSLNIDGKRRSIAHPQLAWREPTMENHIITSSLNTEGKWRSITHPQPAWRHQWCPHRYILTEYRGKAKIHHPFSASLEGTNDGSRSCNINIWYISYPTIPIKENEKPFRKKVEKNKPFVITFDRERNQKAIWCWFGDIRGLHLMP